MRLKIFHLLSWFCKCSVCTAALFICGCKVRTFGEAGLNSAKNEVTVPTTEPYLFRAKDGYVFIDDCQLSSLTARGSCPPTAAISHSKMALVQLQKELKPFVDNLREDAREQGNAVLFERMPALSARIPGYIDWLDAAPRTFDLYGVDSPAATEVDIFLSRIVMLLLREKL